MSKSCDISRCAIYRQALDGLDALLKCKTYEDAVKWIDKYNYLCFTYVSNALPEVCLADMNPIFKLNSFDTDIKHFGIKHVILQGYIYATLIKLLLRKPSSVAKPPTASPVITSNKPVTDESVAQNFEEMCCYKEYIIADGVRRQVLCAIKKVANMKHCAIHESVILEQRRQLLNAERERLITPTASPEPIAPSGKGWNTAPTAKAKEKPITAKDKPNKSSAKAKGTPAAKPKEKPNKSSAEAKAAPNAKPKDVPAVEPAKPAEPVEPAKPAEPAKPVEPAKPEEPAKPVEPTGYVPFDFDLTKNTQVLGHWADESEKK